MSDLNNKMMNTPDLNNERLELLKKHMPDLFTDEGKLNENELKKLIDSEYREEERFDFRWLGKTQAKRLAFSPVNKTLLYDPLRSIHPDLADGNLIIEGENLESLKILLAAYREKIKCIYIDPPYNTGKDFIYKDNFDVESPKYQKDVGDKDEKGLKLNSHFDTSGRYHSDWLNMIYPRLLLAKQLLRDDGVIFISINDYEIHNLRKVCDEVFGMNNFVDCIIWCKKKGGGQDDDYFAREHEYILCYKKRDFMLIHPIEKIDIKDYSRQINGRYCKLIALEKWGAGAYKEDAPTLHYPIKNPDNNNHFPIAPNGQPGRWRKKPEVLDADHIYWKRIKNRWKPYEVVYYREGSLKKIKPRTILYDIATTTDATEHIKELFNGVTVFQYSKPYEIILHLIKLCTDSNDMILDFFAGSGTTAEATEWLNIGDNGDRKFILIQANEAVDKKSEAYRQGYRYISDICIERNKRALAKMQKNNSSFNSGFKVYKLADSQFARKNFTPNPNKTDEENLKILERYIGRYEKQIISPIDIPNLFDEILLKQGFTLNYKKQLLTEFKTNQIFKITDQNKECLICLDAEIMLETIKTFDKQSYNTNFICLDASVDINRKWDLKRLLKKGLIVF